VVDVTNLRREGDQALLEIATVTCSECGATIGEDEAQAARWAYWSSGLGELYPFCWPCAAREFEHRSQG
jgi:hypothetical protein